MMSGRLVAATTKTPLLPSTPSISVSSWFTTLHFQVLGAVIAAAFT